MLTAVDELGGQIETNASVKHLSLAVVLLDTASGSQSCRQAELRISSSSIRNM